MAANSNTAGFETYQMGVNSAFGRQAISFQSGAITSSSSEMIPMMGDYFGVNNNSIGVNFSRSSSNFIGSSGLVQGGSSSSLILDTGFGLRHDAGFAAEWSLEEQQKLEMGLREYAKEQNIMKYIKIAAKLPDKTVRDVALRCRWLTRKRRKPEDHNLGRKINIRKDDDYTNGTKRMRFFQDKLQETSSIMNIPSASTINIADYSAVMSPMDRIEHVPCEVTGINNPAKQLLEHNVEAFNQIASNLRTYKLQDNIDLFCQARSNLATVLNEMRGMHGIMSQMPPLPVSINEDLANSILPSTSKATIFRSTSGIQLKQEPRC